MKSQKSLSECYQHTIVFEVLHMIY